jgi:ATP-dependent Clp protease ATP-binding subunit ClpC
VKVDARNGEFVFDTAPRGEKVAVGIAGGGEISATPDLAVNGG